MPIVWCGLTPHPPIIVEAVGGPRCREVQTTIDSMRALMSDMLRHDIQRLVIISPHTPRPYSGFSVFADPLLQGDFSQFGAHETQASIPNDTGLVAHLLDQAPSAKVLHRQALDHGAMVPLHFAIEAGWKGNTAILGLPWSEGPILEDMGSILTLVCEDQPTAIIASGDMSHCLKADGPYGHDPAGPAFDAAFVEAVKTAEYRKVMAIDDRLRQEARQDVVESCRVAWQAGSFRNRNHHFYSYEGPFGVGYTVMKFFGEHP